MTIQPQQPNPMQNNYYYPDDEIELIDYLRVLWKWKWLIIMITFVCMVAAGVVSFMMPKIYEVSMAIGSGVIDIKANGNPVYLDSTANIKAKIESGIYNSRILKNLNIDSRETQVKFKAANPKGTNLINISSEWTQDQMATGIKALEQLLIELSHDYEDIVQAKTKGIDSEILFNLSSIQGKKKQIDFQQAILKNIKARKNKLNQELMTLNDDIKRLCSR